MPKVEKDSTSQPADSPNSPSEVGSVDLHKLLGQQLDSLRRAGLTHLPAGTGEYQFDLSVDEEASPVVAESTATATSTTPVAPPSADSSTESSSSVVSESKPSFAAAKSRSSKPVSADSVAYGEKLDLPQRQNALEVLQAEVAGCTLCSELASSRTQTVFGVGNPAARLVFLGEGPGANEDRLGEPFVGEAGQLLDKILGACGLSRSDVYILNTVKCRPPANRNPAQDELGNCFGFAEAQLEILQPEFICCLGSVASRTLLKTTSSIGKLRKRFHTYRGSQVLVTYHPAYLLRTPSAKKHVWEDMKMLMKEMGIELPK